MMTARDLSEVDPEETFVREVRRGTRSDNYLPKEPDTIGLVAFARLDLQRAEAEGYSPEYVAWLQRVAGEAA